MSATMQIHYRGGLYNWDYPSSEKEVNSGQSISTTFSPVYRSALAQSSLKREIRIALTNKLAVQQALRKVQSES